MHGFKASADPAWDGRFRVSHIWVHDVWYPRISSIWGPSRPPASLYRVPDLAQDFLQFRRPGRRYPQRDGRYLLILPVAPARPAASEPDPLGTDRTAVPRGRDPRPPSPSP